jgi:hypothetical protein
MGFFSNNESKKTQLYLRDDRKFQFIKRPLKHSCLVEEKDGKFNRAWKHFYNAEIPFSGYKNISGDSVTLSFARDIILDPYNKIKVGENPNEKPRASTQDLTKWIAKIATNMRHIYSAKRETRTMGDVLFWLIVGVDIIIAIGWAIRYFTG